MSSFLEYIKFMYCGAFRGTVTCRYDSL